MAMLQDAELKWGSYRVSGAPSSTPLWSSPPHLLSPPRCLSGSSSDRLGG